MHAEGDVGDAQGWMQSEIRYEKEEEIATNFHSTILQVLDKSHDLGLLLRMSREPG